MRISIILASAMLAITASTVAYGAERIGVAAAVRNSVTASIGGATNALATGDAVFQTQVITADATGGAQLIFLDQTVFTVGSGATVTLDEFIYNPNSTAGSVVLNVTQGAFRFVSGTSNSSAYTVRTPVATIGLRGTIFSGNVRSRSHMTLSLDEGELVVCPEQGNRVEGDVSKQTPIRQGAQDCVLILPGNFDIGSAASPPPSGDITIRENETDALDIQPPPIRCIIQFGVPVCN